MLKTPKAQVRLRKMWDIHHPGDPVHIEKAILKPRSSGAVGYRWVIAFPDGRWYDIGYTVDDAEWYISHWDTPLLRSSRELTDAMRKLEKAVGELK